MNMELKLKYTNQSNMESLIKESDKMEMESLQKIVEKIFEVKLMKLSRIRELVDARMVYAKILRDRGYTFKVIASSLNKDHTTVVHYMSMVETIFKQDSRLLLKYMQCRDEFLEGRDPIVRRASEKELTSRILELNNKIDELTLERDNILSIDKKNRRLESIIELIDKRTPQGAEKIIERRINQMFNDI